jgi:hypothetical protein
MSNGRVAQIRNKRGRAEILIRAIKRLTHSISTVRQAAPITHPAGIISSIVQGLVFIVFITLNILFLLFRDEDYR